MDAKGFKVILILIEVFLHFSVSQMDNDKFVPIATVARFNQVSIAVSSLPH